MDGYDIIGDIHGREAELRALLTRVGYREEDQVWHHPRRKALFIGDFIDRDPARGVLNMVRAMVRHGTALAIMGNHELNAIAYDTPDPNDPEQYLRPHSEKNREQHAVFRGEFESDPDLLKDTIAWFKTLPAWLDLGELRAVHASWYAPGLQDLAALTGPRNEFTEEAIVAVHRKNTPEHEAMENVLKGVEAELPGGITFRDKGGHERDRVRLKWWLNDDGLTWPDAALGPPELQEQLPRQPLPHVDAQNLGYPEDAPPVFVGHYWLDGEPRPQASNVACVDYSVGMLGGRLVAYRWSGEGRLREREFVHVSRS
ncbi:MAG TPA: metallophosphoesterase [Gammaproteobacteria bacterium]|nr:metallophosphoesterase [Gammaproteobacteria bacterium]